MTKSTSGGCDQFEISPEAIDQELRPALCERRQTDRQTDRLKTNYRVDDHVLTKEGPYIIANISEEKVDGWLSGFSFESSFASYEYVCQT